MTRLDLILIGRGSSLMMKEAEADAQEPNVDKGGNQGCSWRKD